MNCTAGLHFTTLAMILVCLGATPVLAGNTARAASRDNSGRRIAVVVPTEAAIPAAPAVSSFGEFYPSDRLPAAGRGAGAEQKASFSQIEFPSKVSPEVHAAIKKGSLAAEGLSRVALKRAQDIGAWMNRVWREMNEFPQMTPTSAATRPAPTTAGMRPIVEPKKQTSQLWFTSENRMKTVVNR